MPGASRSANIVNCAGASDITLTQAEFDRPNAIA
ncbi:hypothetical protein ACFPPD_05355 [Cohnella suwonensis]|uniref:Uncharacterized protein n=1 Tax=Cohnella suwonensis TaxID=696072 RepID=A0ABW0LQV5_9BACL